jgi:hypothetical protein
MTPAEDSPSPSESDRLEVARISGRTTQRVSDKTTSLEDEEFWTVPIDAIPLSLP